MRKTALIGALAVAALGATVAVAQVGGNGEEPKPAQVAECADEEKQGGAFGACVSERASTFGRCVAEAAKTGEGSPVEACSDLHPGNRDRGEENGNGDDGEENGEEPNGEENGDGENGDGGDNGDGEAAGAASQAGNPTEGVTRPPEQDGRSYGQQVAANARENGAGADRNPTAGVTRPPEQSGRDFGQQVSENARGNGGGPQGD